MVNSQRVRFAFASLLILMVPFTGCDRPSSDQDGPAALAWAKELPKDEMPAVGTAVWAAVPRADGTVQFGAYTVAEGALADDLGTLFAEVPAALMRPRKTAAPAAGDAVLALIGGGSLVLGRAAEDGRVKAVINGRVVETKVLAMESLGGAAETFAPVAYGDDVGWQRGLALARSSSEVWLQTPDGRVEKRTAESVFPLDPAVDFATADLEVGAEVSAGSWARGFEPSTVVEIVDPGLAFVVESEAGRAVASFSDIVASQPPWLEAG